MGVATQHDAESMKLSEVLLLCLSWLKLDRTKMTWKNFFSCRLIASRLVRSCVRCFALNESLAWSC